MNSTALPRKTVAVLVDYMNLFAGGFEAEFRQIFDRVCREHDFNLMFVYGRSINHPDPSFAAHNQIYELLCPPRVDGIIALSSAITSYCGLQGAQAFFNRYAAMARCSIGLVVPDVPSVAVDNCGGMDALLEHLIADHKYRRIAFIRGPIGNVEANTRFETYLNALSRHHLEFDESLVATGNFTRVSGRHAVNQILARAGRPDVVVAANDGMALGAVTELRSQGTRVPYDVAVTGFDDLVMARLGDPPLTTIAQPIERMVEVAVELVARQLVGETVAEVTPLSAKFITRQSCGCRQDPPRVAVNNDNYTNAELPSRVVRAVTELRAQSEPVNERDSQWQPQRQRLLDALIREFEETPDSFIREVENTLAGIVHNEGFHQLQMAVARLRQQLGHVATPALEEIWHRASTLIALTNTRSQEQFRLDHDQEYFRLIDAGERFGAALDVPTLQNALVGALLAVGIRDAYISRFTDRDLRELECFLALREGVPHVGVSTRFAATALMPPETYPEITRRNLLAFPLTFNAQSLGIAVFEPRAGVSGYQIVRDQISGVLRSISLHQEILQQITSHEQHIQEQERKATAERIQSLSVLAGGVAHDLNNVLGPLVALPDVIIEELSRHPAMKDGLDAELRTDIEMMKIAALRASQTIKDLLTLGRQGQTTKQPLDLNAAIARCIAAEAQQLKRTVIPVELTLCSEPLIVVGSETHLNRAITNLVRNALDAIDDKGVVKVETGVVNLSCPISGYETIAPGAYAVVVVSDTGCGIAPRDLTRLFEPFFTNKRLSDRSGSGLGLAIVHGVVKDHCGFVNVETAIGLGTKFTLYLPRIEDAESEFGALASVAPRGHAKILVVDDELIQRRTCQRVLSHLGYDVDTLSSGHDACSLFHARSAEIVTQPMGENVGASPYDLVILDMLLDEQEDGLQVFDRIRALFPNQKGIIASGHAPTQLIERALQRGLCWLAKPYTQATLARAVNAVLAPTDSSIVQPPSGNTDK